MWLVKISCLSVLNWAAAILAAAAMPAALAIPCNAGRRIPENEIERVTAVGVPLV